MSYFPTQSSVVDGNEIRRFTMQHGETNLGANPTAKHSEPKLKRTLLSQHWLQLTPRNSSSMGSQSSFAKIILCNMVKQVAFQINRRLEMKCSYSSIQIFLVEKRKNDVKIFRNKSKIVILKYWFKFFSQEKSNIKA